MKLDGLVINQHFGIDLLGKAALIRWFDRTYVCTFDCYASYVVDVFIVVH